MVTYPLSSVGNTTLCWRCGTLRGLMPLWEVLREQTEKRGRRRSRVRKGIGEGVLFVLPSSCSITPPFGEADSL